VAPRLLSRTAPASGGKAHVFLPLGTSRPVPLTRATVSIRPEPKAHGLIGENRLLRSQQLMGATVGRMARCL
jgi:hypothetical protein